MPSWWPPTTDAGCSDFVISDLDSRPDDTVDDVAHPGADRHARHWTKLTQSTLPTDTRLIYSPGNPSSGHRSCASRVRLESTRRSVLATLMSVDAIAGGSLEEPRRAGAKRRVQDLAAKALCGVSEASCITTESDTGIFLCFLDDPEEALCAALVLRGLCLHKYGERLPIRIGVHIGPLRTVPGLNQQTRVLGDGVNVAQRVMDFAHANQIVASKAYFRLISAISDMPTPLFKSLGAHLDRDLRAHDIYAVQSLHNPQASNELQASDEFADTARDRTMRSLTAEAIERIEAELNRWIGPLAQVLVKKAAPRATDNRNLRRLLAVAIADGVSRRSFLAG
ncbi:MAG: hypothetical protein JWP47_683 [Polaromonas sp.]|nr:hypothetical protein [Polaromonas sp.]